MYHYLLDGPFRFCKRLLKSKVRRRYSTIYKLSLRKLGAIWTVSRGHVMDSLVGAFVFSPNGAAVCAGSKLTTPVLPLVRQEPGYDTFILTRALQYYARVNLWCTYRTRSGTCSRDVGRLEVN